MTETVVAYHVEDGVGRPAINVKAYVAGIDFWPESIDALGDERSAKIVEIAYDRTVSDFWQAAQEIAEQRGLGSIEQQGRSGGWLVFTDAYDPADYADPDNLPDADDDAGSLAERRREWLAAYRAMVEWADAWIADAPRKVASLAQDYAMDEAGEDAARRMFFERFARRSDRLVADYRAAHPDTLIGEGAGA